MTTDLLGFMLYTSCITTKKTKTTEKNMEWQRSKAGKIITKQEILENMEKLTKLGRNDLAIKVANVAFSEDYETALSLSISFIEEQEEIDYVREMIELAECGADSEDIARHKRSLHEIR